MTRTIAVTTPTGNVGSKLIPGLLAHAHQHGLEVRLLARKPFMVAQWVQSGVRVCAGHIEDPDFLVSATQGVDALYWATPNSFAPGQTMREGYRLFAESAATAIKANKIAHTVHLSGFAHVDDGGGGESLFRSLADSEATLAGAVEDLRRDHPETTFGITHLRAGFFFENLLGQLHYLREHGRIYLPVNQKQSIPMVCSHDVAQKALELLLRGGPRGRAFQGAYGPRDLSFAEVSSSLTAGVGRKLRVLRLPRALIRHQMLKLGRDPRPTGAFMIVFDAISRGKVKADPPRDHSSTTPTSMTQWAAEVLKPLIEGAEGAACPARVQFEAS